MRKLIDPKSGREHMTHLISRGLAAENLKNKSENLTVTVF